MPRLFVEASKGRVLGRSLNLQTMEFKGQMPLSTATWCQSSTCAHASHTVRVGVPVERRKLSEARYTAPGWSAGSRSVSVIVGTKSGGTAAVANSTGSTSYSSHHDILPGLFAAMGEGNSSRC